jgi:hypothetical protein
MFQRIEKLRKHSFASMCVWGEANNNTIAGIWFWKGHELVFPVSLLIIRLFLNDEKKVDTSCMIIYDYKSFLILVTTSDKKIFFFF